MIAPTPVLGDAEEEINESGAEGRGQARVLMTLKSLRLEKIPKAVIMDRGQ